MSIQDFLRYLLDHLNDFYWSSQAPPFQARLGSIESSNILFKLDIRQNYSIERTVEIAPDETQSFAPLSFSGSTPEGKLIEGLIQSASVLMSHDDTLSDEQFMEQINNTNAFIRTRALF